MITTLRDRALKSGEPLHVGDRALDALWDGLDRVDGHFWHMEEIDRFPGNAQGGESVTRLAKLYGVHHTVVRRLKREMDEE